ncbi:MAG: Ig-like domain-containing protein [Phycisphaerales bacterium]|nr:MAG: Ig-like domain-containing protein [Phycisphaerales bacterium]
MRSGVAHYPIVAAVLGLFIAAPLPAAVIPIGEMILDGEATVTVPPWDIGSPESLFDRNFGTLMRTASVNPAVITIEFSVSQITGAARSKFSHPEHNWTLEAADSLADLDSQSGTWVLIFGPIPAPGETVNWVEWNGAPVTRRFFRFTVERMSGDDYVHIYELELQTAETVHTVMIDGVARQINMIEVSPAEASIEVGTSLPYSAEASLSLGPDRYDVTDDVTWATGDSAVATITPTGLATGVAEGTTAVHADLGPVHGEAWLDVWSDNPAPLRVQRPRTFVVHYNPIIEEIDGTPVNQRLYAVPSWWPNVAPQTLTAWWISDMDQASHGLAVHRIVNEIDADVYPIKQTGFRYTDQSYFDSLYHGAPWYSPDAVDYKAVIRDYDLARKVDAGQVNEVHIDGAPYFGYWESTMAGLGAYYINSGPVPKIACSRLFAIMGFNYERGVAEMLHSLGHRCEDHIKKVHGGFWDITQSRTDWERFTHNITQSGDAACGTVHYPPNAASDYDYTNPTYVTSTAIDWMNNFPNLTGQDSVINREAWGGPDYHRNFMKWWYSHMPHVEGRNSHDGYNRLNNWWEYIFNINEHEEAGGDHVPGGPTPPADPYGAVRVRITDNVVEDWHPRVSSSGRVVWYGSDGTDYEIYSCAADGSGHVQITANGWIDEAPQINGSDQVVWQAFDGQDYEIFTANADGSGVVRITDNTTDDWHPQINDAGRIVWDGWDGADYEIYSCDIDGSNLVQVTDNGFVGERPRDDVWPQINDAGRLVWFGHDGSDWEIYSANTDGTGLVNLSDNSYEDEYPQINAAGRVVWHSWVSLSTTEVYSVDATGGTPVRLTNDSRDDWYPQIGDDNQVVWMSSRLDDWEIRRAMADGSGLTLLTANATHDQYPRVDSRGRVLWQGFDGEDWEIYAWIDGAVHQLTDNSHDDLAPSVAADGGAVTWHAESAVNADVRTFEVYVLVPLSGDLDLDGDVDVDDFTAFADCLSGPDVASAPGCDAADLEDDGDVDLKDFAQFQGVFTGP